MKQYRPVRRILPAALTCVCLAGPCGYGARAQQLIGYVSANDANVTGATDVLDGQAVLAGSVGVTAKDRTATVTLGRGGLVHICQSSAVHMTESNVATTAGNGATTAIRMSEGASAPPLLFSLDRGAVEIQMNGLASDAIMTPDLRFTVRASGPLDLRLRVARNGDTCVENHGAASPTLAVSDPFGESNYELMAGQHVLFEHGNLHEVVDHEAEPCGCPEAKGANMAEALLAPASANTGAKTATAPVLQQHPFPAAISEGLAPAGGVPQATQGEVHTQVTDALSYNGDSGNADKNGNGNGDKPASGNAPLVAGQEAGAQVASAAPAPKLQRRAGGGGGAKGVAAQPAVRSAAAGPSGPQTEPLPGAVSKPAPQSGAAAGNGAQKKSEDESPNRDLVHMIGHFFHMMFRH